MSRSERDVIGGNDIISLVMAHYMYTLRHVGSGGIGEVSSFSFTCIPFTSMESEYCIQQGSRNPLMEGVESEGEDPKTYCV